MRFSEDMLDLLDNIINTLSKWDLLCYVYENPNDRITAEEIAAHTCCSVSEVLEALRQLAACKVLEYEHDGEAIYYRYCPHRELQTRINSLMKCSAERNNRWLMLNYLIEKSGFKQAG